MKNRTRRIDWVAAALVKHPLRSGIVLVAGVATVIGCGYSMLTDHSVRFNTERVGRGFYRLPPLPFMYDRATGKEISTKEIEVAGLNYEQTWDEIQAESKRVVDEVDNTWREATEAIERVDLDQLKTTLTRFLELTTFPLPETSDEEAIRQRQRNTATDMLDAIAALRRGSRPDSVKAYLDARLTYDEASPLVDIRSHAFSDANLEDNWDYLEAAASYRSGEKQGAYDRFKALTLEHPRSEKREAALYMTAKIEMESSYSFGNSACGFYGVDIDPWEPVDLTKTEPAQVNNTSQPQADEKCRDGYWHTALESFRRLMLSHPNGRYYDDSHGWVAHLHRRGGQRAEALAEYYKMLGHPTSMSVRLEAKRSLQMLGHHYDDETLDRVEELLAGDVKGAMAYAYHRIYNHAADFTYQAETGGYSWGDDWNAREKEKERVAKLNRIGNHELERVAKFATKMMQRHPRSAVSGGFVLRVAEAQLELQNFEEATKLAAKALALGVLGDLRAQALWVKGSGEHQRRHFTATDATFTQLVAEFPGSKFVEGARRVLAMNAEDRGDLETALEMYMALDYKTDVAYFLDVLLSTERLEKFIDSRKNHLDHNQMLYGLGVRYMREKRWDDARATLARVKTEKGVDEYLGHDPKSTWYFAKEPSIEDEKLRVIKASWVIQDLKTIDTFEHFEKAVESAEGDEAKAEAMYQLASAYYEADDVALYNPEAWGGARVSSLYQIHFTDRERSPNESQIILEHMRAHDPLAHAIPIFEEIVARFPQTKVARDALYSTAVAHERLAYRNGTWDSAYKRGLFPGPRLVTYADVKSTYPNYQLPRGTYGWKPSTRTVNGGPGWAAAPKPLPRETREHKIKRLLREFKTELKTDLSSISNKLSNVIDTKVDAGVSWWGSMIEAAVYGILSGVGLWALILIGIRLHLKRLVPEAMILGDEEPPPGADSRVDKMIG